jgi:hypothetical protein
LSCHASRKFAQTSKVLRSSQLFVHEPAEGRTILHADGGRDGLDPRRAPLRRQCVEKFNGVEDAVKLAAF